MIMGQWVARVASIKISCIPHREQHFLFSGSCCSSLACTQAHMCGMWKRACVHGDTWQVIPYMCSVSDEEHNVTKFIVIVFVAT